MDVLGTPLNGTKTHPLSDHAIKVLRQIMASPVPRGSINPGCADRLEREDLVRVVWKPSPYSTRKDEIRYLEITKAGVDVLQSLKANGKGG